MLQKCPDHFFIFLSFFHFLVVSYCDVFMFLSYSLDFLSVPFDFFSFSLFLLSFSIHFSFTVLASFLLFCFHVLSFSLNFQIGRINYHFLYVFNTFLIRFFPRACYTFVCEWSLTILESFF